MATAARRKTEWVTEINEVAEVRWRNETATGNVNIRDFTLRAWGSFRWGHVDVEMELNIGQLWRLQGDGRPHDEAYQPIALTTHEEATGLSVVCWHAAVRPLYLALAGYIGHGRAAAFLRLQPALDNLPLL